MRPPDPKRPKHALNWTEVLYYRLSLQYERIPTGTQTAEAEDGLHIHPPCAYFYIGSCHPRFGDNAIVFICSHDTRSHITPFDTGGLWKDHLVTEAPLDEDGKRDLLARYDFEPDSYLDKFRTWGRSNYSKSREYVERKPPRAAYVPEIDSSKSGPDGGSWTWEGRTPRDTVAEAIEPLHVFLNSNQIDEYDQWLRDNPAIPASAKTENIEKLIRLHLDAKHLAPGEAATRYLAERELW